MSMVCNTFRIGRGARALFGGESGAQSSRWWTSSTTRPITGRGPERGPAHLDAQLGPSVQPPQACYELRLYQRPPRKARPSKATLAQRMQAIPQPEHRQGRAALPDYRGDDLRPNTVELRADSLINFAEFLASHNRFGLSRVGRRHPGTITSGQQPLTAQADQSPNESSSNSRNGRHLSARPADRCAGKVISESFQSLFFPMMLSI